MDNGANAGAYEYAREQQEARLPVLRAYGNICTCVTRGNSDITKANVLMMSAKPDMQVGITHWSQPLRRSSRNDSALGATQSRASPGTEKLPSMKFVGSSPGLVHSR